MAEITLQINTSGAWRNVMTFAPGRRAEVLRGLRLFASILGPSVQWCLLREGGSREWLPGDLGPWLPITNEQPLPLQDVLVSVYHQRAQPMVFAAYRRGVDEWIISGTDHERVVGDVYAWAPCLDPAPHSHSPADAPPVSPRITCCACGKPTDNALSPLCADCYAIGLGGVLGSNT